MEMNQLYLLQSVAGYRYSIDSFILADFVSPTEENKIVDFGTGNGIIPLLLSRKTKSKIAGLDIQYSLLQHARRNIAQNRLENQVMLIQGDIRFSKSFLKNGYFDIVVSNPPYRKLNSGRLNPNEEKAIARHEILITLPELLESAFNLLCNKGKLVMIYLPERYDELVRTMAEHGLIPKKIRFICSNRNNNPKMFLIEGVKKEDLPLIPSLARRGNGVERKKSPQKTEHFQKVKAKILDPLYIYDNDGNYTLEMQKIYDSFNNNRGTNSNRKI
jgi:tRNA1(Val) A37 N6-methylase TrmN6